MIKIGDRVLTTGGRHQEFIGLNGTVIKEWNIKPEYTKTLGNRIFRVKFDNPVHSRRCEITESALFKESDLQVE